MEGGEKNNYGRVRLQEETIDVPRDYADQARKRKQEASIRGDTRLISD